MSLAILTILTLQTNKIKISPRSAFHFVLLFAASEFLLPSLGSKENQCGKCLKGSMHIIHINATLFPFTQL